MDTKYIDLVKKAISEELKVSDELVIEELYNNELLSNVSMETIDYVVHYLSESGEISLV